MVRHDCVELLVESETDVLSCCRVLLTPQADTMTESPHNISNSDSPLTVDQSIDVKQNGDPAHVSLSIINVVQTCFAGLMDSAQSHETRRLMLQNYQIATKLLRSALATNPTDGDLAAPIRALALYEVRLEPGLSISCRS